MGFLVSFSGNEESERESNTRLPRCHEISGFSAISFFGGVLSAGPNRKDGLSFTEGQTVRPRSNVPFSP